MIDKALELCSEERPLLSNDSQHIPYSHLHTLLTSIESLDVSCKFLEAIWLQHLKHSQVNTRNAHSLSGSLYSVHQIICHLFHLLVEGNSIYSAWLVILWDVLHRLILVVNFCKW